ncbi:SacI homology domain-containing protein [Elsinoe ampelina]|uniref:SacI homology domain-containing protein n=1 Tax=Elsinoe ampelina TaxID=302913 RepID=A0A6A6FZX6_9PEZI|nr:SacI homology domain-containing protein [Elsinoe ampelina]
MRAILPFRDINVHASSSYYSFSSPSTPDAPTLVVDRPSGDIRLNDGKLLGGQRVSSIQGILGIISLRLDKYVVVITKSKAVGKIRGNTIYNIVSTELLPLRERPVRDPEEDRYVSLVETTLKTGPMYYSYTFDLTNSFQRQSECDPSSPMWKRADDRFFWNRFISSDLINFRNGESMQRGPRGSQPGIDPYILPVMFGMLRITNTSIKGNPLNFVLITRRSRHRTGTRYFTRGLDEQGHASNFNETEQTIILNDEASIGPTTFGGDGGLQNGRAGSSAGREAQILAYVQTRGSVPVFWAEVNTLKYTPNLQIRGVESAVSAAKLHFDEQIRLYGENYLVNLVNQKGRERPVKDAYEKMVNLLVTNPTEDTEADRKTREKFHVIEPQNARHEFDHLHYIYFDFHNETKGLRWHRTELLMDQLKDGLTKGGYFHGIGMPDGRIDVRNKQRAVVRTNCMDCLDRTNVVQSMLGRWSLNRMMTDLGLFRSGEQASEDSKFEHLFRNIWADNADVVSKSYSGTGALKTDFTRTGNRTKAGALQDLNNSITRYVCNNFNDGPRQDAFDLFLGAFHPDQSSIGSGNVFTDSRPVLVQAIPYILAGTAIFIFTSLFTTRLPDATVWPLRIFTLACLFTALWAARFVWSHGSLYVNWPKLNTPEWAQEAYYTTLEKATKDPLVGSLVTQHRRGRSDARVGYMEEGKKRIE